jgi:hypothetical protein
MTFLVDVLKIEKTFIFILMMKETLFIFLSPSM